MGQGPTALAIAAGGGCLDIFSLVCHLSFFFSLSLGDGPTEILFQTAVKPKTTNQPSGGTSLGEWEHNNNNMTRQSPCSGRNLATAAPIVTAVSFNGYSRKPSDKIFSWWI